MERGDGLAVFIAVVIGLATALLCPPVVQAIVIANNFMVMQ